MRPVVTYRLIEEKCAWCDEFPCACAPLVRTSCACGAVLEAFDDLESKRRIAELHTRSLQHLRWRHGR